MQLLICAGGTGGGVYPALSILQALANQAQPVLWVGGQGGMEAALVARHNVPFAAIPAAGVHGVGLRALPGNLYKLVQGVFASRRILKQFKPQVLLFTGGFVAAPMALARGRTPTLLFVPDIEPGLALNFLARFSSTIAVTAEESRRYFPKNARVVVTGYPTRPELQPVERSLACQQLHLDPDLPVLLVFGGSKGARSINRAVVAILPELLPEAQIVHLTGELDHAEVAAAHEGLPAELQARYHVYPYLHDEMALAFSAADLVVCRAGASTLGELPLFGLPAVLVPYPHAWRYQRVNAAYLTTHSAAVMLEDSLLGTNLLTVLRGLLHDPAQLAAMRAAMRSLAAPQAAQRIAELVCELAGEPSRMEEPLK